MKNKIKNIIFVVLYSLFVSGDYFLFSEEIAPVPQITELDKDKYYSKIMFSPKGSAYQLPPINEGFRLGFGDKFLQDLPPGSNQNWQPLYLELKRDGFYFHFVICWITQNWVWGDLDDPVDPGEGGYLKRSDFLNVAKAGYIPVVAFKTSPGINTDVNNYLSMIDKLSKLIDIGKGYEVWVMLEPGFNMNGVEYWDGFNDLMIAAIDRLRFNMVNGTMVRIGLCPGEWGPYPQTYSLTKCISRAAEYCDFLAVHILRDSAADFHKRDPWTCPNPEMYHFTLNFVRYLNRTFNKPILIGITGVSTGAWGEDAQDEFIKTMFEHRGEFMAAGVIGYCNYSYYDNDGKDMGLIGADGHKKKAWYTWRQYSYEVYMNEGRSSLGVVYPKCGDIIKSTSTEIKWIVSGGKGLIYDVYYSSNSGQSYALVATRVSTNSYVWDVSSLPAGTQYRVKIVASDGAQVESEDFTINRGYGSNYGLFDFESGGTDLWGKIPGTDDNTVAVMNSTETASYGKRSLKAIINTSPSSSVTKIGVFQTLDIDLRYSKNKVIKLDVYLPKELGPAPGITKACLFIHDPNWRWIESDKMWPAEWLGQPLHYGWNTVYFDLDHPEIKSQLTGLYPIHTVGLKLITDLEYQNTYIYIDHLVVGDQPEDVDVTPPVLTVEKPNDGETMNNYIVELKGSAYDENFIVKCYYSINDGPEKQIPLDINNSFSLNIPVPSGLNKITIIAEDAAKNRTEQVRNIYVNYTLGYPPQQPQKPNGVSVGATWAQYSFSSSAIDPNGDQIKYIFDWGDGSFSETGYGPSGWQGNSLHYWISPGVYNITVYAVDINNNVSQPSEPLSIIIDDRGGGLSGDLQFVDPKEGNGFPDFGEVYIADDNEYIYFLFHFYEPINSVTETEEYVYLDADNNFYTGSMQAGGADYRFKIAKLDPDRWYTYIDPVQYWSKEGSGWLFLTQVGEGSAPNDISLNRTEQTLPTGTVAKAYSGMVEFRFKKSWTIGNDRYQIGNVIRWWIDGSKDDVGSPTKTYPYLIKNNKTIAVDGDTVGPNEWEGAIGANMKPVLNFVSPRSENLVGYVNVEVTALDDKGIKKVEFYLNNYLVWTSTSAPYRWGWDTTQYNDGNINLKVVAYDTDNESVYIEKSFKIINNVVDTPPVIKILEPLDSSLLSGTVKVKVQVSDDFGIDNVEYYLDTQLKYITNISPYSWDFDTTDISSGSFVLKAVARDIRGQTSSDQIVVSFKNIPGDKPPSVKIISISSSNVSEIYKVVNIEANDDKGIDKVEFYIDNKLYFIKAVSPYDKWSFSTINLSEGSHKIKVVVYDTVGQTATDEKVFDVQQSIYFSTNNEKEKILSPNNDGFNDIVYFNNNNDKIKIFDLNGFLIKEINDNKWDGKNNNGEIVSNGVYIYKTNTGEKGTILVIK